MESRVSGNFWHIKDKDGYNTNTGFSWLDEGVPRIPSPSTNLYFLWDIAWKLVPDVLDLINKGSTEYRRDFQKGVIYEWNLDGMSEYQVVDMAHHIYVCVCVCVCVCYRTYLTLGKQNPVHVGNAIIAILLKILKVFVNDK